MYKYITGLLTFSPKDTSSYIIIIQQKVHIISLSIVYFYFCVLCNENITAMYLHIKSTLSNILREKIRDS
jgi:hypothetical protein